MSSNHEKNHRNLPQIDELSRERIILESQPTAIPEKTANKESQGIKINAERLER